LICHEEVPVGDIKGEKLTKTFLRKKVHIFTYRLIWKKIVFSRKTSYNGNVKGVPSIKYVGQIFYKFYKNVLKNQLDIYFFYYIYMLNYQVSNTGLARENKNMKKFSTMDNGHQVILNVYLAFGQVS
jgi:hypothetical protein